ncbi:MAG: thiosulfate sulfurtransferase [Coxiella sp. RIFCSPHIGHO2_12_FULL_44_14]|nr:MAG: thiosulfate sulfurtransferase [Coxiella sp. RIFCSPHIGHO2_12_FULL_44_14]
MYKQISHTEAEQLIAERKIIIADVRDQESYSEGHITHAIHLSMSALKEYCEQADKSKPILLYCYHGISSQSVAQHLVEQGFLEVYSLVGGFETWKAHHPTSITNK